MIPGKRGYSFTIIGDDNDYRVNYIRTGKANRAFP